MALIIAPSLLAADFCRLADDIRRVEEAGAGLIHVDVMDGHFVPNLTFGPVVVRAVKRCASRPLDLHLMLDCPGYYVDRFIEAGANWISFHAEATTDPRGLAQHIRKAGVRAGLAISPATPVRSIEPFLDCLDFVLVMTVEPGFGGQPFMPECLPKIREARALMGPEKDVEVDGGVNGHTIADVARAGANVVVAGSAVFGAPDPGAAVRELKRRLQENHR